jgi:hypothetical protein
MLPDGPKAREKFLCAFRVAKASHATLAFARRLTADLCAVVQSGRSFDEQVLHVGEFRDPGFCRRIAVRLIVDTHQRARCQVSEQYPRLPEQPISIPLTECSSL